MCDSLKEMCMFCFLIWVDSIIGGVKTRDFSVFYLKLQKKSCVFSMMQSKVFLKENNVKLVLIIEERNGQLGFR